MPIAGAAIRQAGAHRVHQALHAQLDIILRQEIVAGDNGGCDAREIVVADDDVVVVVVVLLLGNR